MSVMVNLIKSPVANLRLGMLKRLIPGVRSFTVMFPCSHYPFTCNRAALIERKPGVDDATSSVEFLHLLPAVLVRISGIEAGKSGEDAGSPASVLASLLDVVNCLLLYLESDVKVARLNTLKLSYMLTLKQAASVRCRMRCVVFHRLSK